MLEAIWAKYFYSWHAIAYFRNFEYIMIGHHTIPFYILISIMAMGVLQSVVTGGLFFFKSSGVKRSNYFFGALLICFGLTLLHNILFLLSFYDFYPRFRFLPIYFSLSFPVLLFYYVKLDLYPNYRLKPSDAKHFILPTGQFIFLLINCLLPVGQKIQVARLDYSPFYGALEYFLYLSLFFAYLYFARRYIVHKWRKNRDPSQVRRLFYLRKLVKILFILFVIHTIMVVSDYIAYRFLQVNMRAFKPYAALSILSFTALVLWTGTYGFQVLLWGRRVFGHKWRPVKKTTP